MFAHEIQNTVYLGTIVQAPSMGSYHESNWYGSHFEVDENSDSALLKYDSMGMLLAVFVEKIEVRTLGIYGSEAHGWRAIVRQTPILSFYC